MNSPLFRLISKAGNASLGELMARSSTSATVFAREIADLVRDGNVTLSFGDDTRAEDIWAMQSPAFRDVTELIKTPKQLVDLAEKRSETFVDWIEHALNDDRAALSIKVDPTSRGFRYSA
jgi:hypothetical protein